MGDAMESGLLSMKRPQGPQSISFRKLLGTLTFNLRTPGSSPAGFLEFSPNVVRSSTAIAKKKVLARISATNYAQVELAMKRDPREKDVEAAQPSCSTRSSTRPWQLRGPAMWPAATNLFRLTRGGYGLANAYRVLFPRT